MNADIFPNGPLECESVSGSPMHRLSVPEGYNTPTVETLIDQRKGHINANAHATKLGQIIDGVSDAAHEHRYLAHTLQ